MIELANILLCGLQPKAMRCITHLQTHFCIIRDDPSWTIRDARMPCQDTAMSDGDAFRVSLEEMATSAMSEKAAASWEAGDILQTRPAGLVV
jgi:hypothetical protein